MNLMSPVYGTSILPQGMVLMELKCSGSIPLWMAKDPYLVVCAGNTTATIQMPVLLSAIVVVLGDKSATIQTETSTSQVLDSNGVAWQ